MPSQGRLDCFASLLAQARERLGLCVGFVLWNGVTVPASVNSGMLAIRIADEGVVAALLRKPNLDTLVNLWVTGRVDILNGTIFDLAAERPNVRTKAFVKALDKGAVIRTLIRFLFVPRGGSFPLEQVHGHKARRDGTEDANRENVHYHYDVSNRFYQLFLDPEMVYTCAYFRDWSNDITTAQQDKMHMICRKLRLKPNERMLDIGCGWGALICHAARHYGVRATGVTLSIEQAELAREKIARLGLQDRVDVVLQDYTKVEGHFDKISSIGMFEQVGIANHPAYFSAVNRLLRPGGLYLHHTIARPAKRNDKAFAKHSKEYAALTRYIFPGGELDHLGMSIANLQRHGFEVHDVEGWREHYARTCRLWHDRLLARMPEAEAEIGIIKTRLWLAYLAGCSLAFQRNTVGIFQTLASKRVKGSMELPPTRVDLYEDWP
ncbi:MAG: class I SAM-dependent methyltransferase [Acetobacteraceae bacterium]